MPFSVLAGSVDDGAERRNLRARASKVSSVIHIGWKRASPVPTKGPNGTKPRCRYNPSWRVVPEMIAKS